MTTWIRLRRHALQHRQPLGVGGHLQQRGDLELPGELGVGDLVRPVAEDRRRLDAQQEVGLPAPGAVEEGPLVDDVDAAAHRLDRLRPPRDVVPRRRRPSSISATDLPAASSDARYFFSCSRPRSKTNCSSSRRLDAGAAHSPAATPEVEPGQVPALLVVRSGRSGSAPAARRVAASPPCLPIAVVRQPA